MHSTRRSILSAVAVAAGLALSGTVSAAIDVGRSLIGLASAYVLRGLSLFSERKQLVAKQAEVRTCLTARERHDLRGECVSRPRVEHSWRLCQSA